jgi:hypothetical protein
MREKRILEPAAGPKGSEIIHVLHPVEPTSTSRQNILQVECAPVSLCAPASPCVFSFKLLKSPAQVTHIIILARRPHSLQKPLFIDEVS